MKVLLFSLLILFTFNFGCKPTSKAVGETVNQTFNPQNPVEEFAVELFEVIKQKDYYAFLRLMADDIKIRKQKAGDQNERSQKPENSREIFDSFYEKDIDWEKVNISKVTFNTRGTEILKTAQVAIKFSAPKNKCTLSFPNWLKQYKKDWKIGGLPPEFNCLSN